MLHRLHWIIALPAHTVEAVAVIIATVLLPSTGVFAAGASAAAPERIYVAPVMSSAPRPATISQVVITPAPVVVAPVRSEISSDTPVLAQGDYLGGLACAPTSVSMVLGYYHARSAIRHTATPQQLASESDVYMQEGVPYQTLAPRIVALGYPYIVGERQASFDELASHLANGPVIALIGMNGVRGELVAGSFLHSVVVVNITSASRQVTLNDPWTGKQLTISEDEFNGLWHGGENSIVVIQP